MTFPRIRGLVPGAGDPGRASANASAIGGGEAAAPGVGRPPRTGLAMIVIMAGVLMTAIDTTIVVLALPEIQRSLDVALSGVVWVIISFLLVITLLATQVGRLGDMYGRVRMYEAGFVV